MAARDQPRQDYKKIRAIRELFKGRYTDTEVALLLGLNHGDKQATVTYILDKEPRDVRQEVENERRAWEAIQRVRSNTPNSVLDSARSGKINTDACLFACRHCDKHWWRLAPNRKLVSKCFACGRRYDVVPRDKWWGWAEFNCHNCENNFNGWCHMQVYSPCYTCQTLVLPTRILPPKQQDRENRRERKSAKTHSCAECAPYFAMRGRGGPIPVYNRPPNRKCRCAHPQTRKSLGLPDVIDQSPEHDSTGSTVATFLPQGDLTTQYVDAYEMESIAEEVSDVSND